MVLVSYGVGHIEMKPPDVMYSDVVCVVLQNRSVSIGSKETNAVPT